MVRVFVASSDACEAIFVVEFCCKGRAGRHSCAGSVAFRMDTWNINTPLPECV